MILSQLRHVDCSLSWLNKTASPFAKLLKHYTSSIRPAKHWFSNINARAKLTERNNRELRPAIRNKRSEKLSKMRLLPKMNTEATRSPHWIMKKWTWWISNLIALKFNIMKRKNLQLQSNNSYKWTGLQIEFHKCT